MERVVVSKPSSVWVPCCYLAFLSTEFVGSCKICNLVSFEVMCNGKNLVFRVVVLSVVLSWLFLILPSTFSEIRVLCLPYAVILLCFMVDEFFLE